MKDDFKLKNSRELKEPQKLQYNGDKEYFKKPYQNFHHSKMKR